MARTAREVNFQCPTCGPQVASAVDSRRAEFGGVLVIRRRRLCPKCEVRHSTLEIPERFLDDALESKLHDARKRLVEVLIQWTPR